VLNSRRFNFELTQTQMIFIVSGIVVVLLLLLIPMFFFFHKQNKEDDKEREEENKRKQKELEESKEKEKENKSKNKSKSKTKHSGSFLDKIKHNKNITNNTSNRNNNSRSTKFTQGALNSGTRGTISSGSASSDNNINNLSFVPSLSGNSQSNNDLSSNQDNNNNNNNNPNRRNRNLTSSNQPIKEVERDREALLRAREEERRKQEEEQKKKEEEERVKKEEEQKAREEAERLRKQQEEEQEQEQGDEGREEEEKKNEEEVLTLDVEPIIAEMKRIHGVCKERTEKIPNDVSELNEIKNFFQISVQDLETELNQKISKLRDLKQEFDSKAAQRADKNELNRIKNDAKQVGIEFENNVLAKNTVAKEKSRDYRSDIQGTMLRELSRMQEYKEVADATCDSDNYFCSVVDDDGHLGFWLMPSYNYNDIKRYPVRNDSIPQMDRFSFDPEKGYSGNDYRIVFYNDNNRVCNTYGSCRELHNEVNSLSNEQRKIFLKNEYQGPAVDHYLVGGFGDFSRTLRFCGFIKNGKYVAGLLNTTLTDLPVRLSGGEGGCSFRNFCCRFDENSRPVEGKFNPIEGKDFVFSNCYYKDNHYCGTLFRKGDDTENPLDSYLLYKGYEIPREYVFYGKEVDLLNNNKITKTNEVVLQEERSSLYPQINNSVTQYSLQCVRRDLGR